MKITRRQILGGMFGSLFYGLIHNRWLRSEERLSSSILVHETWETYSSEFRNVNDMFTEEGVLRYFNDPGPVLGVFLTANEDALIVVTQRESYEMRMLEGANWWLVRRIVCDHEPAQGGMTVEWP